LLQEQIEIEEKSSEIQKDLARIKKERAEGKLSVAQFQEKNTAIGQRNDLLRKRLEELRKGYEELGIYFDSDEEEDDKKEANDPNQTNTTSTSQNSQPEAIIFSPQRLDSYPDFFDLILAEEIEYQGRKVRTISISKSQIENDLVEEIKKLEKKKKYEITFSEIELKASGSLSEKGYLIGKQIISLKKVLDKGKGKDDLDKATKDATVEIESLFNLGGKNNEGKTSPNPNSIIFTIKKIEK
jgi:hypothetical protein